MAGFPAPNARPGHVAHDVMVLCAAVSLCSAGLIFYLQRSPAMVQIGNADLPGFRSAPSEIAPSTAVSQVEAAQFALADSAPDVPAVSQPAAMAPSVPATFYLPFVPAAQPSAAETALLNATNAARAARGLAPLMPDDGLNQIARIRARQLADQGYFGHVDPAGYTMYTELLALTGRSYRWAGENLALNDFPISESPDRAFAALMESPDHRDNILAPDYARVGIGELTTPDGRHIYAMIFVG